MLRFGYYEIDNQHATVSGGLGKVLSLLTEATPPVCQHRYTEWVARHGLPVWADPGSGNLSIKPSKYT